MMADFMERRHQGKTGNTVNPENLKSRDNTEETVFGEISPVPRNVICIMVQGLTAGTLSAGTLSAGPLSAGPAASWSGGSAGSGFGSGSDMPGNLPWSGPPVATPNLEVLASMGVSADFCPGAASASPDHVLAEMLTEGRVRRWDGGHAGAEAVGSALAGGWLPARAHSRGKLWLSVLPRIESSWPAAVEDDSASCTIVADVSPRKGSTPMDWDDLARVSPRAVIRHTGDDGFMRSAIEERILSRFPGPTSRAMHGGPAAPPRAALDSWVEWLGDAFIRSVWFSMDRPGGTAALLYHPAPEVYAALYGPEGYRWAVEQVDDLAGRLLMLAEHDQMGDLAFIVLGDRSLPALTGVPGEAGGANADADAGAYGDANAGAGAAANVPGDADAYAHADPGVPVFAAAPGIEPGSVVSYCTFAEVSRLMGACL